MPLFSVVIPTYNRAAYIRSALESVRRQQFQDYEAIVVDDGSNDGTLGILNDYEWVKLLRQENQGPGAARNLGVSHSSGEYIAFLDSDDIWFPWALAAFAEVIQRYGQPDLVAATLQPFRQEAELQQITRARLHVDSFADYYEASCKGYFVGAGLMVVRKQAFQATGGFTNERIYAEDCDLSLRLGVGDGFVQILAPVTLGYREHSTNARRNLALICDGITNMIDSEWADKYPGGPSRRADRIRLVTLHTRPTSIECVLSAEHWRGWLLYLKTLRWHLKTRRWKYIVGFPALALAAACGILRRAS
jgi:glycosyltransferase involved in cell wall biosynthesis